MLTDGTETEARLAIQRFLADRSPDETVLLYLACHAIRDRARLYFAATDTWLRYPQRSALPASTVIGEMDLCGAGNRLLILDCCFSGGFAEEKGELDLAAELGLPGRGIALLSGSRAREYSYEGRPIGPELPRSVFTEGLAVGLATGAADVDGNGIVTVAEAYNYAYRHVSQNAPRQAPQYYLEDGHGDIILARAQPRTGPQAYLPDLPDFPQPPRVVNGAGPTGAYGRMPDAPPGTAAPVSPAMAAQATGARPAVQFPNAPYPSVQQSPQQSLSVQGQPAHAKPAESGGGCSAPSPAQVLNATMCGG